MDLYLIKLSEDSFFVFLNVQNNESLLLFVLKNSNKNQI